MNKREKVKMLSKEKIKQNKREILGLVGTVGREGIDDLVLFLERSDFFSAPASTKFHGNYEGGLAAHSYEVYKEFCRQVEHYELKVPIESLVLTGVCHDFCKIGLYQPNPLKSGKLSDSKPYKICDSFPFGHGEKSVVIANRYVQLSEQEAMIIRWHMGSYDPSYEQYRDEIEENFPEAVLFHHVDMEVSKLKKI